MGPVSPKGEAGFLLTQGEVMGIYGQIMGGVRAATRALAGELINVNGTEVSAIVNEEERAKGLILGAMKTERTLVVQFESGSVTLDGRGRNLVEARGQKWQISADPGSIKIGAAATTLVLVEPERSND